MTDIEKKRLVELRDDMQEDERRMWNHRDSNSKCGNKWYFYNGKLHKINEDIVRLESAFPFLKSKEDRETVK